MFRAFLGTTAPCTRRASPFFLLNVQLLQRFHDDVRDESGGEECAPHTDGQGGDAPERSRTAPARLLEHGLAHIAGADVREGSRKHPQPGPQDVRAQVHAGQAVEVVRQRKGEQGGEPEEKHELEGLLPDCLVYRRELLVLLSDLQHPVPRDVASDEERYGRRDGGADGDDDGAQKGPEEHAGRHGQGYCWHGEDFQDYVSPCIGEVTKAPPLLQQGAEDHE
mmetsp:Transcript_2929/g.7927  ORF Transcript_2929/g.7927 Transcript_2929/m.7927 type:complete len:222 (-) Transcript_2929:116-781(-)